MSGEAPFGLVMHSSHVDVEGRFDGTLDVGRTFAKNPNSFFGQCVTTQKTEQLASNDFLGGFIHTCPIWGTWNIVNMCYLFHFLEPWPYDKPQTRGDPQ